MLFLLTVCSLLLDGSFELCRPKPAEFYFAESCLLMGTGYENLLCADDDEWP